MSAAWLGGAACDAKNGTSKQKLKVAENNQ